MSIASQKPSIASKFAFTDLRIKSLSIPPGKVQFDFWDERLTGFGMRVSAGRETKDGDDANTPLKREPTKTWQTLRSVKVEGKWTTRRTAIGRYPAVTLADARKRATQTLADIDAGIDVTRAAKETREAARRAQAGAEATALAENSYARVVERYLADLASKPKKNKVPRRAKTLDGYRRVLANAFSDWADKPLAELTHEVVEKALDRIAMTGDPHTPYVFLRAMFRWAKKRRIISIVPTDHIDEPAKPVARDRHLTADELRLLWLSLPDGWVFTPWAKLLILLGQRREEIAALRWSEVTDLATDAPFIELAGGATQRVKNDRTHKLPLPDAAAAILRAGRDAQQPRSHFVFTTTGDTPISGYTNAKTSIDKRIAIVRAEEIKRAEEAGDAVRLERLQRAFVKPWVFHDLRHTFATGADELGIAPHTIDAVTNHVSTFRAGVSGRYNHAENMVAKRAALDLWARHVAALVDPTPPTSNVLPFVKTAS